MASVTGFARDVRRLPFGNTVLVVGVQARSPLDLVRWLRDDGYLVDFSPTGVDATERVRRSPPDAVILRPPLPDTDARQFISFLLALDVPMAVLVLVTDGTSQEVARWLELGVDDCVSGHDASEELSARMRIALRRRAESGVVPHEIVEFAGVRVDLRAHTVLAEASPTDWLPVDLSPVEYEVLLVLVRAAGRMLSPHELLAEVWNEAEATSAALRKVWMAVSRVRGALRSVTRTTGIETIPRVGYRLVALPAV